MIIRVDPAHREPPYQQVRLQILAAVASSELPTGTRLPTIRQLADDLDLAANTVARAYRELEADGVIETRGRKGTFVGRVAKPGRAAIRAQRLDALAAECVAEARRLGAPGAEIAAAVARALAAPAT